MAFLPTQRWHCKHVATSRCATAGERSPAVLAQCLATVRPAVEEQPAHGRMHQITFFALNTALLAQASTGTPVRRWTHTTTPSRTSPTKWRLIIRPPSKTCVLLLKCCMYSQTVRGPLVTSSSCGPCETLPAVFVACTALAAGANAASRQSG